LNTLLKQATEDFSNWLGSSAGYNLLNATVRHYYNDSSLLNHDNSILFSGSGMASGPEKEELIHETVHDFILFLFESFLPVLSSQPEQCDNVLNCRYKQLLNFAWNGFVWQVKEKGRSKQYNERGYLYRKARQVISKASQFVCLRLEEKPFSYRPAQLTGSACCIWSAQEDSFAGWAPPSISPGKKRTTALFSSSYLIAAGEDFYTQAQTRALMQPVNFFMPVKEFVRYLATCFPWVNRPARENMEEESVQSGKASHLPPEKKLDVLRGLSAVEPLAVQLVAGFNDEECAVLVYRFAESPWSFKDIAAALGYPDHNKAYRLYTKVRKQLIKFCSNWPGEPLSELPEDVAMFFLDQVLLLAKKRVGARYDL